MFVKFPGCGSRGVPRASARRAARFALAFALVVASFTSVALAQQNVSFSRGELAGTGKISATSLQFGPDGRLYVADWMGDIEAFEIQRLGPGDYSVSSAETITLLQDIPNHDDDGSPNLAVTGRLVTGLLVTGTAAEPVVYVQSSDPRIGGGSGPNNNTDLDTNSGILSRLVRRAGTWTRTDLVRGLPRSEENHHTNGLALSADGNTLYMAAGGNTNEGAPSSYFAELPEYALSAAILKVDLQAIGDVTYDLPTLDDESRPGVADANDPFGGNAGKNQAILLPGSPVVVHAPGFRNAYDLVLSEAGELYTSDNGGNAGWGGPPVGAGTPECSNEPVNFSYPHNDRFHHVTGPGYYGGHPNPTRANTANTFNPTNPQSPVSVGNPVECDFIGAGNSVDGTNWTESTNGMVEYRAGNFAGALQGKLLAASHDNAIWSITLNAEGGFESKDSLFNSVGRLPLDVTAQDDDDVFPGTVWVADFVGRKVVAYEPGDYDGNTGPVCSGDDDATLDEDADGFDNADEIANGTDACSGGDFPPDADDDKISDLTDDDDDNDGLPDVVDRFALDPANGRDTSLPVDYGWENDAATAPGFLFNLGFSGLMSDGVTDYLDRFDSGALTAGGAAGVFTLDELGPGSAQGLSDDQQAAFQFGVDVTPSTPPFEVSTRILAPFGSTASPSVQQSAGFYVGTGTQYDFIKLVARGDGSVALVTEFDDSTNIVATAPATLDGVGFIDLFLAIDPSLGTVDASFATGDVDAPPAGRTALASAVALPADWLTGSAGLAIGIIGDSGSAAPFSATWDYLRVLYSGNQAPVVNAGADAAAVVGATLALPGQASDDGLPDGALTLAWTQLSGPGTATFADADAAQASVTFDAPGAYELELFADDGLLSATDALIVTVQADGGGGDDGGGDDGGGDGQPGDFDGDGVPDASDPDDDGDGIADGADRFALDAGDGAGTVLPLRLEFAGGAGALLDSGFTGLMANGDDYASLQDVSRVTVGPDRLTIASVGPGDPHRQKNSQTEAYQLGVPVLGVGQPVRVRTRILTPFAGVGTPRLHQSMGLFVGTGTQDDYAKLALNSVGSTGGIQFALERGGFFRSVSQTPATVFGAEALELELEVDAVAGQILARYRPVTGGVAGAAVELGSTGLPGAWLAGDESLAAGIISTSTGSSPFDVSWDHFEVTTADGDDGGGGGGVDPQNQAPVVEAGADVVLQPEELLTLSGQVTDDGLPTGTLSTSWIQVSGPGTVTFADPGSLLTPASLPGPGIYELRLSATDGELTTDDSLTVTVQDGPPDNQAPVVDAGADVAAVVGATLALPGQASDDGLPDGALTLAWTQLSGPGTATFADADAAQTSVTFDVPGAYELELFADDGLLSAADALIVTVQADGGGGDDGGGDDGGGDGQPGDFDGDGVPDASDPDDDGDGIADGADRFALDASDGAGTVLPLRLEFAGGAGALLDSGFTGLMANGDDYASLQDVSRVTVGPDRLTIASVGPGDPHRQKNSQTEAYQLGVPVLGVGQPVRVRTRILTPFAGVGTPRLHQSMGLFVGTGTQDDYAKLALNSVGSTGGIQFALERGGFFRSVSQTPATVFGAEALELELEVDAVAGQILARYRPVTGGVAGAAVELGSTGLPGAWLAGDESLAAGIISTSTGSSPFDVSWDHFEVTTADGDDGGGGGGVDPQNQAPVVEAGADATLRPEESLMLNGQASDDGLPTGTLSTSWSQVSGPGTVTFADPGSPATEATFDGVGDYVLRLEADDGEASASDSLSVSVVDAISGWRVEASPDGTQAIARHEAGAVTFDGKLYLMGGRGSRAVSIHDPASGTWTTGTPPPFELHHFQPVVAGGRIWVVGAMTCCFPNEPSVTNVWSYEPVADSWEEGPEIPVARRRGGAAAVVRDGLIYLVGGNTAGHGGPAVAWADEFDPSTGGWRILASAPTARDHAQAVLIGSEIILAGGRRTTQPDTFAGTVAAVDRYDIQSDTWSSGATLPTPRAGTMAAAVDGEYWVAGGETAASGTALDTVEIYDPLGNVWRAGPALNVGRHSGGAAYLAGRFHTVSGNTTRGGGSESRVHESVDPAGH